MSHHPLTPLLRHVRQLTGAGAEAEQTDRQLLQRYAACHDEDAFAFLVQRHGAMVLGVCRRLLPNSHDAEDAFQATFVLLAQKAAGRHWHESAAGWLHEAAQRVARHARRLAGRRHGEHRQAAALRPEAVSSPHANAFLRLWLEEELRRLPEKHRMPLVLCHLEGYSHEEAARLLGWPIGTVKGRIARGLEQLRCRLARQGEPCSANALALALGEFLPPLVPPETLASATVNIAVLLARGTPVAETASASVTALLSAVRPGLFTGKVKLALVMLLGTLAAGAAVGARRHPPHAPPSAERQPQAPGRADRTRERRPPPSLLTSQGIVRLSHRTTVTGLGYSPDGKTLATGNMDSGLYLWDVASGKEVWRALPVEAFSIAFSPDGRTLAAGGWKGIIRIWDAATHGKLREFTTSEDLYTLVFSPDGKVLAGGGRHGGVHLWDAVSGKAGRFFKGQGRVHSVAFSPDGTLLAYGTTGDRAYVLDSVSGEEAHPFRGKELRGGCVAFSPDGRIIATGGSDRGIAFVDFREVATGGVIRRLRTDSDRVHALAFSPDGRALAVGGSKPAVKVWGLATGQLLGEFEGHQDEVFSVRFSPDGTSLAAGSRDRTAIVWDVPRRMKKEKASSSSLAVKALDRLWADLASEDVPTAYRAMWALRAAPEQALPLLRERLRSATAFDDRRVKQLIGDLDSDRFAARQRAETELAKMGWVVEPALRRALKRGPSLEMRRRLTNLLRGMETASGDAKWVRVLRAVAVLEWVGTPASARILKTLANGAPEARLTREAAGALRRLAKRPAGSGATEKKR